MKTYLFIIPILFFVACRSTQGMRVQVKRPAKLTVPKDIQQIALLNRSLATNTKGKVEGVMTLELPNQDKDLSNECIRGINETLNTSDRFIVQRVDTILPAGDPASLQFSQQLDWAYLDSLAAKLKVDAILSLEYFDTDFKVVNPLATVKNSVGNVLNGQQTNVEVKGSAKSFSGFRIYKIKDHSIIYEDRYEYQRTWTQTSTNPIDAVSKLVKKHDALLQVSYEAGEGFAMDIIPLYYWENRMLYKGKKEMQTGLRRALAKDWSGAIQDWTTAYESTSKTKIKSRAAYNLALGFEVQGDLQKAQEWIQLSYVLSGSDDALRYSNIIDKLIRDQDRLKEQTN